MKNVHRLATATITGLLLFGTAACGSSYDRGEAINDFVESGMTEPQATCLIDQLELKMGVDRLGERGVSEDDLTEEELTIIQDATLECLLGG